MTIAALYIEGYFLEPVLHQSQLITTDLTANFKVQNPNAKSISELKSLLSG
jgi:hypothetical protein